MALGLSTLAAPSVNSIRHSFEERYRRGSTFQAAFFERYNDGAGGATANSGTVYFSRPGRMRWEYESPEMKLFIVDGTNAWFYVPADRTVSHAKIKESSDWRTPLALLTEKTDLTKLCSALNLIEPGKEKTAEERATVSGDNVLQCTPRGNEKTSVLLETDPQAYLVRVLIREQGGVSTEFRFGNWKEDVAIPEVKFHFQPPPGVAVVEEDTLADSVH